MSDTEDSSAIVPEAVEQEVSKAVSKIREVYTNLGLPEAPSTQDAPNAGKVESTE
jgi:hypothetical protein